MSKIAVFKITGISPLLQNNPSSMARTSENLNIKKIPLPEEEASQKVYRDETKNYYILSESFRSAIIGKGGAASGRKIGKRTAISACSAAIFTVESHCPLLDQKTGKPIKNYSIDTRRAVVQGQGVLSSRPMFENWMTRLPLEIDEDWVTVPMTLELLNIAGKVAGVGDFRPQRKGSFGRFKAELESVS